MTGADVKIENIYKGYKDVKVLKDVNLKIEKGDFLTILGPSGAGKTTLLKMIAGFEALGALDKQLRKQMQLEIKRMHEDMGLTNISVTHDQEEALTMSTKVCVMKDGMISQIDSPEDIYSRPINVFVANFIGEANIESTVIEDSVGDVKTIRIYGQKLNIQQKRFYLEKGIEASAVIRPEKIRLVSEDYDGMKIGGTACQVVYVGDTLKILMRTDLGHQIKLKVFTASDNNIKEGDKIYVTFSNNDVRLLTG